MFFFVFYPKKSNGNVTQYLYKYISVYCVKEDIAGHLHIVALCYTFCLLAYIHGRPKSEATFQCYFSCDFLVIVIVKVIIFQVFQLQFWLQLFFSETDTESYFPFYSHKANCSLTLNTRI